MKLSNDNIKSRIGLSISHTVYPDRTLDFEIQVRHYAMRGMEFKEWAEWFENRCNKYLGSLCFKTWRLKPHYADGSDKIVDVELWKGNKDYALSFEEKAILVKILKNKL